MVGHRCLLLTKRPAYVQALIANYSRPEPPALKRGPGRPRTKPRRAPDPELLYGRVDKRREGGRVVEVRRRIVFGTSEVITEILGDKQINTSYVERDNLTSRPSLWSVGAKDIVAFKEGSFLTTPPRPRRWSVQFCTTTSIVERGTTSIGQGPKVATTHARDGGWTDRSCLEFGRITIIPCSAIQELNLCFTA